MAAVKSKSIRPLSRRERSAQTRSRIVEVAYRLFTEHGYEATTMRAIAARAGVAEQTVYFTFRTKGGLLAAIEERAIPGGDQGPDWQDRLERELRAESDPHALIASWVDATATVQKRITAFVDAVGAGLPTDSETIDRRNRGRDRWFGLLVDRLAALNALARGLTDARALDIARALVRVEAYRDMTQAFGWSEEDWREWMTRVLTRELTVQANPKARAAK